MVMVRMCIGYLGRFLCIEEKSKQCPVGQGSRLVDAFAFIGP